MSQPAALATVRKRIGYLLHVFPQVTDTFIRREIRSLQKAGTFVHVISVWKPDPSETAPDILADWAHDTEFLLPRSPLSIAAIFLTAFIRSPLRFLQTLYLAYSTARPGVRGFIYQIFYFVEAVLASNACRRNSIDHLHNHIGDQSGTVTMLAAKLAGIGYSITFHGWPVFFDAKSAHIKEKVRGATFTRAISYFCRSQLMMFSEWDDPTPFKVVHCGLEIGKYKFRPPREQVEHLFCAARLSPEKGFTFLIRALKILTDKGHSLELRLAGDGPSRAQLDRLARDLGVVDRVHFLGYMGEDAINKELRAADLFVLPSFVEGVPVSAMEAMAMGVPVIATNIGATSELVEDRKTGLLVRPSDAEALAEAVIMLIRDYDFRTRAAELARKKVTKEFEIQRETAKLNRYLLESCAVSSRNKE
jgi:glycosyltransferase involved in cell wall biosynthesis